MLYTQDSQTVSVVCTLAGVKPAAGIVNTLNEMSRLGLLGDGVGTYGDIYRAWLRYQLQTSMAADEAEADANRENALAKL